MTVVLWILVACASAVVMALGSRAAIMHAVALSEELGAPSFIIGVTLVAVGTDIPEIVNSVVASYAGHGDITLGDATGSVFTQITLGLGLFPFVAGFAIVVVQRDIWLLSALTVAGMVLGAGLYLDGSLSRLDAIVLLAYWCAATSVTWRSAARTGSAPFVASVPRRPLVSHATRAIAALALVGGASAALVGAVVAISTAAGLPEYLLSFFGAAIATSLPELAVELTALRSGQRDIALGDVLGSCLVDGSLAVAIGPMFFPTLITPGLAYRGVVIAVLAVALAGTVLAVRRKHDHASGGLLLLGYLAGFYWAFA